MTKDTPFTADDVATAKACAQIAREAGDMDALMALGVQDAIQGTVQGQALQARKALMDMTPSEQTERLVGQAYKRFKAEQQKRINADRVAKANAEALDSEVAGLDATDLLNTDFGKGDTATITPEDVNRYGQPINEQQRYLIEKFGL